ncbi:hypothetical protein DMA15_29850 [Streptomyces sp. WAC 01529]|uniref:hypothetical protein n=1 Tax=Streptomyces sp. WAC 01529 TaxID=2203205 RepID=UPI000F6CD641|nr:hypothetical protein [Streptomyces sp. WAC 01529]AZM56279.1 hypothetical protein DMA15_29850 [Streptomyces sp. WAC 01529]
MHDDLAPPMRLAEREAETEESGFFMRVSAPPASVSGGDEAAEEAGEKGQEEILSKLRAYGAMKASRDDLIREADAQQIEEARIARLMGHSRTTIRAALGKR